MYNSFNSFDSLSPVLIMLFALFVIGLIVLVVFYLLTLQNTLKEVSAHNRSINPGQVWLMFIPFFNIVWQFIMVNRIADSLKKEFAERQVGITEDRPGAGIGIAYCILNLCGGIPVIGPFASLAGLICWIIYWVKINDYKNKLIQSRPGPF